MIKELILKNRSYRRFHQETSIDLETLRELVDYARLSASAMNQQPLKYILSNKPEMNAKIFPQLSWAGFLKKWAGPEDGEQPSAYIIILNDSKLKSSWAMCDLGIAVQSILLGAVEKDLGGCIIASVKKEQLREPLGIPTQYEIFLVIALGKPKEQVIIEPMNKDGDTKYWRDHNDIHHVPKRNLNDIIIR